MHGDILHSFETGILDCATPESDMCDQSSGNTCAHGGNCDRDDWRPDEKKKFNRALFGFSKVCQISKDYDDGPMIWQNGDELSLERKGCERRRWLRWGVFI